MPKKYNLISELYESISKEVVANPQNWQSFLRSACYNYRLRFDEQLLVYAQSPEATAVLEIERWNVGFGRWVNKGAKGIAVFEDASRSHQRLKYYFDISDTHAGRGSRNVPVWQMNEVYTDDVVFALEDTFGELRDKSTIEKAVISVSKIAVEDNIIDYLSDLILGRQDSFLEELDDFTVAKMFEQLVTDSVAYMMMSRLGLDADSYFEREDFNDIVNFNTAETLSAVGIATSDIAEMGITEIAKTIRSLDSQNRTFAELAISEYNKVENKSERSNENGKDYLHDAGRLSPAEPENATARDSDFGTVRRNEEKIPEGAPQSPVLQSSDEMYLDGASGRNGEPSSRDGRILNRSNGSERGSDRTAQSRGYDELGTEDEQYHESSTRDSESGSNFRLDYYDRSHEDKSLPFLGSTSVINEILRTTPHLKASKDEIRAFLETSPDSEALTEYIKGIFNNDYTEVILSNGERYGYKTFQNVLHLWKGSYTAREAQSFYDWGVIAQHFEGMRLLGELTDTSKPLPSIEAQTNLIDLAGEEKAPAFSFSQQIIDAVLTRGSNISDGKMRIYEQFLKSFSKSENIDFLKNEYGWGGTYPVITGTGIDEMHDGKGIHLSYRTGSTASKLDFDWSKVEKRISELIKLDRYLNPKELEKYPEWLREQEERRRENAKRREAANVLNTAPHEKISIEQTAFEYSGYHFVPIGNIEPAKTLKEISEVAVSNNSLGMSVYDERKTHYSYNEFYFAANQSEADVFLCVETGKYYLPGSNELFEYIGEFKPLEVDKQIADPPLYEYEYHLGDKVYIGASEYEILSFDDERVMLFDSKFPLINREETRKNFDNMVAENPMNDHLKVPVEQSETADIRNEETTATNNEVTQTDMVSEYNTIKENAPDSIVLYQVGDFFEVLGNDAKTVAKALDLTLMSRSVNESEHTPMCGFPYNNLRRYTDMLLDRGYDVTVASVENGKRIIRTIISSNRDEPVESYPVGRIDYLGNNGKVRESIEYTDEYRFKKDIKEENFYGVPMSITVYRQKDGATIDTAFVAELSPSPQGFTIEDYTSPENPLMKQAKKLIDDFCNKEYDRDDGADFSDMTRVEVAFTTTEDEKHEIQAAVNLISPSISTYIDDILVETTQYESLETLIENGLSYLDYGELVYVTEEQLAPFYQQELSVEPAWEQKKKSKVNSFDLHPDVPMSERHSFNLRDNEVEVVGKKERFKRNMEAIRVLKECEFDNRFATPEEQVILSKYVGWGGLSEAFDENNSSWANEFTEFYGALSPDEYAHARESTLTAFYTPPEVITAIYKAMEQMGFKQGNLLEPSCGIGNFIGMLPDSMQDSKVYGVELDSISAGIAQQLYQKSNIAAQGYEDVNLPDSFFDGVIGNVPFGDFRVADKRYDKHKFLIHDYFFAKSLDKLRPGGVMALVTSKGTMDKESSAVRKYIAQRAELLGAIRLPNDTFKGNAGTEVVSDILILQKRDRLIDIEPDWVHLDTDTNGIKMNSYFVQHPEMVLGEMQMVSGRFGMEATCQPYENAELGQLLDEAIENIHGEISEYEVEEELEDEDNSIPADPSIRNFSYTVVDGKVYYRENSRMTPVDVSATAVNRIKGMIAIRDSVRNLIDLQTEDYPDADIKAEQEKLGNLYDDFTKKYGLINSRANKSTFSQDSSFSLLSALEIIDEEGNLERKADMFFKRTIKPHTPVTSVENASEALAVSMGEKACIDMEYMTQLYGKSEQEIFEELKGVIFLNPLYEYGNHPESKYLMADEYLSGNVREKLAVAKRSAQIYPEDYQINVDSLEKVQPKDLTASEISVRLGATWLPSDDVKDFMFNLLETPNYAQWNIKVHFSPFTSEWNIEGKNYDKSNIKAYNTYGTKRINAYKIIEETLNLKDVRIFDYIEDENGKKKAVLNKKETAIAQSKQEMIKQAFQDWIWSDPSRRERLCKLYNEKFNSIRPREYDGSHITFSGMNPEIELREHQKNAVAHILYGGNTLLAHAVGAGKTFEMVAAAQESKRLGLCTKSLFVVPNHLTEQWAAEYLQLYPAANILVATKKDFETKNRKRFCGRIATGDYDAVIIGHSQFEKIPMSIERQRAILEQQLDEITQGIAELKNNRGERYSIKQLEKSRKAVKTKLNKLNDQSRKDDVVTFEELGVDRIFVDESHYYKNLYLYTKMRNVGGIAQTEAQKSSDLFMKCRYLDEITGGRGTVFATGTPISNSMVELYTIQRYLQYKTLADNGLQHFDAWASTFGETVTAVELTPEGYTLIGR